MKITRGGLLSLFASSTAPRPETTREALPPAVKAWMHCEQELLSRSVDTSILKSPALNFQKARYAPESQQAFTVKSYWLRTNDVHAFLGNNLSPETKKHLVRETPYGVEVRLLVHPESEKFYKKLVAHAERAPNLHATSSSSSRTLLVWDPKAPDSPFFAKLSLDKEIGGVVRTIPQGEVARSVGINNVLDDTDLPPGFEYLHEVMGVMPKGFERGGMIIREIPADIREGRRTILPLFSLYAQSPDGSPPMLAKMIRRLGTPPMELIKDKILSPFLRQWFALAVKQGVTEEPHAQNVLLGVGEDELPDGSFVHRDLGGFNVDFAYRNALGLPKTEALPRVTNVVKDYHADKHEQTFTFLKTYFVGGFVYNLEKLVPTWIRDGVIDGPAPAEGAFRRAILAELESLHRELTEQPFDLQDNYDNIPKLLESARQFWLRTRATTLPPALEAATHAPE